MTAVYEYSLIPGIVFVSGNLQFRLGDKKVKEFVKSLHILHKESPYRFVLEVPHPHTTSSN